MKRNSIHFRSGDRGLRQTESLHPSTRKPGRQWPGKIVCGQRDKYRTNFEDLMELYLFGLRLIEA